MTVEPQPPLARRLAGNLVGRAGWGMGDQALSSLTNFAIGFVAARAFSPDGLGLFTLVFATYVIFLNTARQLAIEPLLIRYSGAEPGVWRGAAGAMTGLALVFGLVGAGLCLLGGLLLGGQLGGGLLALALVLPGLLLQDAWRFAFFAVGAGRKAFLNDLLWALVLVPLLVGVLVAGDVDLPVLILAWGAAANIAALAGIRQAGLAPAPRRAWAWLREHRDLAPAMTADVLVGMLLGQAAQFAIAAVAGLATVGALRASQLVLGPIFVLYQGLQLIAVPEGARLLQRSRATLWRGCVGYAALWVVAISTYGALAYAIPEQVGVFLLKQNWAGAHAVLPAMTVAFAIAMVYTAATVGLRVLAQAGAILRYGVAGSVCQFGLAVGGAALGGAPLSALGNGLGSLAGAVPAWRRLWVLLRGPAAPAAAAVASPPA
ncbi:MAG: hypothetical protein ACXVAE_02065 [Candidatus Limnocylindrales bacterium]